MNSANRIRYTSDPFPRNNHRFLVILVLVGCFATARNTSAQTSYFPPVGGDAWETTDPATLGWCQDRIDSLYAYVGSRSTKAFIVLKDGRIVLERYFGTFTQDSLWYWASAGKTLTSTMVGITQEEGFLDINEPTNIYLGPGWTSETPEQEDMITVRDQLTMTSGLDDGVADSDCTDPACLVYIADAGERWAYHNAPYTLLQDVVANATGQNFNLYFNSRLRNPIGMDGFWLSVENNKVYYSTARSMARFGLMALNRMVWEGDTILHDTAYFTAATTPSQTINPSYGYLWWLNGQASYRLPGLQFNFTGELMPNAPADMFCGLGKNDQLLNVVPSQGLVLIRMGGSAGDDLPVSAAFDDVIWQYMNALECNTAIAVEDVAPTLAICPNPCTDLAKIALPKGVTGADLTVLDGQGRTVLFVQNSDRVDVSKLKPGVYFVHALFGSRQVISRLLKD